MLTITRRQLDRLVLAYQVVMLVLTLLGSTLNLVVPKTTLTVKNGERACFKIVAAIPATTEVLPVYLQIGETTVPLMDMLGNTLYSDQLMTGVCIPGVWGTNPNHFKLCSCVNGRSMATNASVTL